MDNLTHTLVGLPLAESGLKHRSRLGTATLVVAANLPDIDAFVYLASGGPSALAFRRGWTHGVLAMAVLPPLLVALVVAWDRLAGGSRAGAPPAELRASGFLLLAMIGVWSNPLLDLLNIYGVQIGR